LIEIEVVETRRTVAEFQKTPRALADHLSKVIPQRNESEVEAAVDLAMITDEYLGAGAFVKLSDAEREKMSSAYRGVIKEIVLSYGGEDSDSRIRVLRTSENGDRAEAICLTSPSDLLLKLRFLRRDGNWYLVEILQADTGLRTFAEVVEPTVKTIKDARAGQKVSPTRTSDFAKVITLIDSNPKKAVEVADLSLKNNPRDQGLRYLKALALLQVEEESETGSLVLLEQLSAEQPVLAPAVLRLADVLIGSEKPGDVTRAIALYKQYLALEPGDPRAHRSLAMAYESQKDLVNAEAAFWKALDSNPSDSTGYVDLVEFLAKHKRAAEASVVLTAADKHKDDDTDILASAIENLYFEEDDFAEELAASQPERMKTSAAANLTLGAREVDRGRYVQALRLLNIAAQLDKESAEAHATMALAYRKLKRWPAALKAADQALALDKENGDAYYQRACVYAHLGRTREALTALNKAIEITPSFAYWLAKEDDFKPIASLPEFKKLVKVEESEPKQ
jgi:tetratricopeptide (TPR) repeat protein